MDDPATIAEVWRRYEDTVALLWGAATACGAGLVSVGVWVLRLHRARLSQALERQAELQSHARTREDIQALRVALDEESSARRRELATEAAARREHERTISEGLLQHARIEERVLANTTRLDRHSDRYQAIRVQEVTVREHYDLRPRRDGGPRE